MPNKLLAAMAVSLLAASHGSAQAQRTFDLSVIQLGASPTGIGKAGTLTGSFTTDDALTAVLSYDITASPYQLPGQLFTGFEYTSLDSTITASSLPARFFQLDAVGSALELRLFFSSPLTAMGAALSTAASYEAEPGAGERFALGSVVPDTPSPAVPETASWATTMAGVGMIGAQLRRRRIGLRVSFA